MTDEQLELEGMPERISVPEAVSPVDEEWVRHLLDDPDADVDSLLRAFAATEVDPRLRDRALLHPRAAEIDLARTMTSLPRALRDRAVSVTDDRAVLAQWAASRVPYDRAVVAMNPRCPADLAHTLAEDPDAAVRINAACCPQLPSQTRAAMANRDPDPSVREFILWLLTSLTGRALVVPGRDVGSRRGGLKM